MLTTFWFVHFYYKLFSNIPYFSPVQGLVNHSSQIRAFSVQSFKAWCKVNRELRRFATTGARLVT